MTAHELAAMMGRPRWLLWRGIPDPDKPGKTKKIPVSPVSGNACDPTHGAHHVDYATAYQILQRGHVTGLAFSFVETDGFWFLDIDNCAVNGEWSALASDFMRRLSGCAVEVSQSGTGLHLFGRGHVPPHSCKNIPLGLELYTDKRFCAVTFNGLVGDAGTDHSEEITQLALEYFPPNENGSDITGWTSEPRAGWDMTLADDINLIERAVKTGENADAGKRFGYTDGRAQFNDLWTANADALAKTYPGSSAGGYDGSSVDAALAAHLCWWTGHDMERVERLMRQSALVRAKWDDRPEYLATTIIGASGKVGDKMAWPRDGALTQAIGDGPQALRRAMPPAPPYPIDALGPVLAPAVRAIIDRVQCPDAIAAQSVLAVASLATQALANVALPPNGKTVPLSLYVVTVAGSGERKSAADSDAMIPVEKRHEALRDQVAAEQITYDRASEAYKAAHKQALIASKENGMDAIEAAIAALGLRPAPPLSPILLMREPTLEGLHKLFDIGQPSLGLFSDEGGMFVGGNAMNKDNRLKTAAGLSDLWDGKAINRIRAGDGASSLPGRRLAFHLMMQPDVASMMLADPLLKGQGLLSRLLVASPSSLVGTRLQRAVNPHSNAALISYTDTIYRMLATTPPLKAGTRNELQPRTLPLDVLADALWLQFADEIEGKSGPGCVYEPIVGFANKLPEHATRIAAVIELVGNIAAPHLTADCMKRGIELARFYAGEALRLFDAGMVSPEIAIAEKLLAWLHQRDNLIIGLAEIYQRGPSGLREAKAASAAVATLVNHGWLIPIVGGAIIAGKRVKVAYEIVK